MISPTAAQEIITKNTLQDSVLAHQYAPLDYHLIQAKIKRAARRPLFRRLADAFRGGEKDSLNPRSYSLMLFPAYRSDIGWYAGSRFQFDYHSEMSNGRLECDTDVSFRGDYLALIFGRHTFESQRYRFEYSVALSSVPVDFWGVGCCAKQGDKVSYRRKSYRVDVTLRRSLTDRIFIGIGSCYHKVKGIFNYADTEGEVVKGSLYVEYDSRDRELNSQQGVLVRLQGGIALMPNSWRANFYGSFTLKGFHKAWQGSVVAYELYGESCSTGVPWQFWPTTDGEVRFRGYDYGRYIAANLLSAQVELRQRVYKRLFGYVWGGVGELFMKWRDLRFDNLLPSYGVGLGFAVSKECRLRFDYGFGLNSHNFIVNVNEVF